MTTRIWESQQGGSSGGSGGDVYWGNILNKPSTFSPSTHTHTLSSITDLASLTIDYSQLSNTPTSFNPTSHTHAISDITNLQTTLDGKALSIHTHLLNDITDLSSLTLDYSQLLNVPTSFNPSSHNHDSDYLKLSGGTISGSIIPNVHNTIDLGSTTHRFKDIWTEELHLSGNSLYLGDTKVMGTDASTVVIQTDPGQHLKLQTTTALLSLLTLGTNANINLTADGDGSRIQITSNDSEINLAGTQTTITGDMTAEDNLSVLGNLTVTGNLTVSGDNFSANVQTVNIADAITVINHGEVGSGVTNRYSGVQVDRGDLTDFQFVYDEFDDFFKMGEVGDLEIVASRDWVNTNYALSSHAHAISDITNLQTTLDGKSANGHSHLKSDISNWSIDWTEVSNKPSTFTPSIHSHAISDITDLQTTLDGKSATTHNHDLTYLPLTGGTLSNSLTFSNSRIKYSNSLLVSGLVIDSTKWYRVLSVDNNYCPWVDLYIQIPLGHSVYRVRLAKGTGGNGMGWTAEVDCGGIYNYAYGNILQVRVVDMGPNAATYVDVRFNGNATRDIRLSISNELANTGNLYATLIACTDQGTTETGVVSNLGFYDHATAIGVSKSWLSPWGKISIQNSSTSLSQRYQFGTVDAFISLSSGGGLNISTRSDSPLTFYSNQLNISTKRMDISGGTSTALTLYGNASSNDITLTFATVGVPTSYTQKIKFSFNSLRQYVSDMLIPNQINTGLNIGYDDGGTITNSLVIGNGQVAINGPDISSGYQFQVNGNAYTMGIQTVKMLNFYGQGVDSGIGAQNYGIYQASGSWVSPYPDLCIAYYTGIRIGAHYAFGGTRFYGNAFLNGAGNETYLMGVGDGALDVYFPTSMRFGSRLGQHINLYSTSFGLGIQNSTLYLRSGTSFSFHIGGTHSDTVGDPGAGGTELLRININGIYNMTGWFRSYGQTGWYNETYGGGIYMTDTTWIRAYNSKSFAGYLLNSSYLAGTGNRAVYSDLNGTLTNAASDERLKKDISSLTYGLNEALSLNPVFYKWIDDSKMGSQKEIGLIAQQVQEICPEVIGVNSDGMLSLDYAKLIAVLINAVKELNEIKANK